MIINTTKLKLENPILCNSCIYFISECGLNFKIRRADFLNTYEMLRAEECIGGNKKILKLRAEKLNRYNKRLKELWANNEILTRQRIALQRNMGG